MDFVIDTSDWVSVDADGSLRVVNWSQTDGSSVCPLGFRVPTQAELLAETRDNGVIDSATAFANFLKLSANGYRFYTGGVFVEGEEGNYWTNSMNPGDTIYSYYFAFMSDSVRSFDDDCTSGQAVRCLKN